MRLRTREDGTWTEDARGVTPMNWPCVHGGSPRVVEVGLEIAAGKHDGVVAAEILQREGTGGEMRKGIDFSLIPCKFGRKCHKL